MKAVLVLAALLCCAVGAMGLSVAHDSGLVEEMQTIEDHPFGEEYMSALEVAQKAGQFGVDGAMLSNLPESGPYDNPATDIQPTPTIPSSPTCTVRGQTIFEIRKMRADAKQIGLSIMYEIQTMEKRKAYIEQMTAYLNDRIRELNKVKRDLAAEQKWIQVSNQRIAELAQKEKLIKLQDVMSCIKTEQDRLMGERGTKNQAIQAMAHQAAQLEHNIKSIRSKMDEITSGHHGESSGSK
jgi:methyl-accepting chemotaxis protein